MKRGELYRVAHPSNDPKKFRVFVIVSRQALIASRFSTVICAPVYTTHDGLASQVAIGVDEGLKHESGIHCDGLVSLPKSALTNYIGMLPPDKLAVLGYALRVALELRD
ncbi:MAG: type II toxin-antitoxin system PemK/MazF family toxin [Anaerolineae bacterium]|nr:type II toxin-antitoxin system PemK/MazF family toxin [Anaerolineae bacterium]